MTEVRRNILISVSAVALGAALLSATPVRAQTTPTSPTTESRDGMVQRLRDERRGLVYDGLRERPAGPCGTALEIVEDVTSGLTRCTHGPDPAPDGIDVRVHREAGAVAAPGPGPGPATAAAQAGIPCYGTGSDGFRVQLLYVRRSGTTDNSAAYAANFASWAANANAAYNDSAAKTGGVRNIRYVTDASCNLVVQKVEVSVSGINSLSGMINELKGKGLNRSDRKYLAWVDANVYCGIAEIYVDPKPTTTPGLTSSNYSNGNPQVKGTFGRVDNGCWGQANSVEAHELTHMLGGVQPTAPHATPGYHCKDESDRMCYVDGAGVVMTQVCPAANERLLDCNGDDYFNTAPVAGSWLANHWNVANSAFLATSNPSNPPPPPPPTTTTSTTTTKPPTTTTTSTTKPPTTTTTSTVSGATTTTKPLMTTTTVPGATTTTTRPPVTTTTTAAPATPSAPRSLAAYKFGSGILLLWSAPTVGPVTGYNVYRKTATGAFTKIADLGTSTNYSDSTGSVGVTYTYAVSAENGTREGPLSNQVNATK